MIDILSSPPNKNKYKLYASGSLTNTGATLTFTKEDGTTANFNYITVSGLNFPNGIKQIRCGWAAGDLQTFYNSNIIAGNNSNIVSTVTTTATKLRIDGVNSFVNNTGFQLPISGSAVPLTWEAWGL